MTHRGALLVGVTALAVSLLTGCGADEDGASTTTAESSASSDTPTASQTPSEDPSGGSVASVIPVCSEAWVSGATLAETYEGCVEAAGAGQKIIAIPMYCESGQLIATYRNAFYAVAGEKVNGPTPNLKQTKQYKKLMRTCRG